MNRYTIHFGYGPDNCAEYRVIDRETQRPIGPIYIRCADAAVACKALNAPKREAA